MANPVTAAQTVATTPAARTPAADPTPRSAALTRGVAGYGAQSAVLAPPAPAPREPVVLPEESQAPPDASAAVAQATPELSPLREALLEQFRLMEGKGVGDAEFDAICSKTWWTDRKAAEAKAREYNTTVYPGLLAAWQARVRADPSVAKTEKPPARQDDANFTTCIATQQKLLEAAVHLTHKHVKTVGTSKVEMFAYGSMGRLEAKKRSAWVPAGIGVTERPKPGDVLMYEARGEADKVQEKLDGENSPYSLANMNAAKVSKELEQARAATSSATAAIAHAAEARIPVLEAKLVQLKAQHDARIAALEAQLDVARGKTAATAGTEVEAKKGGRNGGLAFSHVGFFQKLEPEKDAAGQPTGRELWTTFDGGQTVAGKVGNQGAKSGLRVYDPKTNEIAAASQKGAAVTQDGKTRWLAGWTNVDALTEGS